MKEGLFAFCWVAFLDQKLEPILLNILSCTKSSREWTSKCPFTRSNASFPLPRPRQGFDVQLPLPTGAAALTHCPVNRNKSICILCCGCWKCGYPQDRLLILRLVGRAKAFQILLICHPWKNNFLLYVAFLLFTATKGWPF